jgi:hypothetical protein
MKRRPIKMWAATILSLRRVLQTMGMKAMRICRCLRQGWKTAPGTVARWWPPLDVSLLRHSTRIETLNKGFNPNTVVL